MMQLLHRQGLGSSPTHLEGVSGSTAPCQTVILPNWVDNISDLSIILVEGTNTGTLLVWWEPDLMNTRMKRIWWRPPSCWGRPRRNSGTVSTLSHTSSPSLLGAPPTRDTSVTRWVSTTGVSSPKPQPWKPLALLGAARRFLSWQLAFFSGVSLLSPRYYQDFSFQEFPPWCSGNESDWEPWGFGFNPGLHSVGWGSGIAVNCGVGHRRDSDLAWLWCRLAATAPIWLLAWEFLYATGMALKNKTNKPHTTTTTKPNLHLGISFLNYRKSKMKEKNPERS